jgi:hypothetical protein
LSQALERNLCGDCVLDIDNALAEPKSDLAFVVERHSPRRAFLSGRGYFLADANLEMKAGATE